MTLIKIQPSAGEPLADGHDPRVALLNDLILKGVAHLEGLKAEGVAKTNFMQCDERSIYVLGYLYTSPFKIMEAEMPPLRRFHNHAVIRHLIDVLNRSNQSNAAAELSFALEESDPVRISDRQASTEIRVCHMVEMHTIIFGILGEVIEKRLSKSLEEIGDLVRAQAILPDTCRPGLAYIDKGQLFTLIATRLIDRGHQQAAGIVLNQKGRPIW